MVKKRSGCYSRCVFI